MQHDDSNLSIQNYFGKSLLNERAISSTGM